jgi:hypothetical protein
MLAFFWWVTYPRRQRLKFDPVALQDGASQVGADDGIRIIALVDGFVNPRVLIDPFWSVLSLFLFSASLLNASCGLPSEPTFS